MNRGDPLKGEAQTMSVVRSAPTFTLVEVKEYNYEKIVLSIFQTV